MNRLYLSLVTGLWGAAVMVAIIQTTPPDTNFWRNPYAVFVGAAVAGAVVAPLARRLAPLWSSLAGFLATPIGAGLAGFLIAATSVFLGPLNGLAFGPITVFVAIFTRIPVFLVWIGGGVLLHLTAKVLTCKTPCSRQPRRR